MPGNTKIRVRLKGDVCLAFASCLGRMLCISTALLCRVAGVGVPLLGLVASLQGGPCLRLGGLPVQTQRAFLPDLISSLRVVSADAAADMAGVGDTAKPRGASSWRGGAAASRASAAAAPATVGVAEARCCLS
eukprot:363122-Chlamydomonas_euryale.AAC.2